MTPGKLNRAFEIAGITMPTVRAHIERNMIAQRDALQNCTAKQLAAIIAIQRTTYSQGQASCNASVEDDAVWVGAGVDTLIPLAALKTIEVSKSMVNVPCRPLWPGASETTNEVVTRYAMDYVECV